MAAYRMNGYYRICQRTEYAQIRLHGYVCLSGPTLPICIGAFFVCCASYAIVEKLNKKIYDTPRAQLFKANIVVS